MSAGQCLSSLPAEIVAVVCDHIEDERDLLALTSTCSRLHVHHIRTRAFAARAHQPRWIGRLLAVLAMAVGVTRPTRQAMRACILPDDDGDAHAFVCIGLWSLPRADPLCPWYVERDEAMQQRFRRLVPDRARASLDAAFPLTESETLGVMATVMYLGPDLLVPRCSQWETLLGVGTACFGGSYADYKRAAIDSILWGGRDSALRIVRAVATLVSTRSHVMPQCARDLVDANHRALGEQEQTFCVRTTASL